LASDISEIIKSEITSTFDSLLSIESKLKDIILVKKEDILDEECVKVEVGSNLVTNMNKWNFYIPAKTSTKFEYLMLGGTGDLKEEIDEDVTDAVKEIVNTLSGSISTSINAQGFDDLKNIEYTIGEVTVKVCTEEELKNFYKFTLIINEEEFFLFIDFDENSLPFIDGITGNTTSNNNDSSKNSKGSLISTLLDDDSVDNLKLLFGIKLRLSVRLGNKICLLRDVISWDIGEIIELTQMTSEPLEVLINGIVIGQGEAVIVDGKFGVKIKKIRK